MAKKALVVGINDYGSPQNNLPSCIADARAFGTFLERSYGFKEVRYLYDGDATRTRVERELDWLLAAAADGDHLVFYYSGHGYTKFMDGNMEEFLVLRDGLWRDNELSQRTQHLPEAVLTVILDSCFSGGMLKLLADPEVTGDEVEVARTKVWTGAPPGEVAEKALTPAEQPVISVKRFGMARVVDPSSIMKVVRPAAVPFSLDTPLLTADAEAAAKSFDLKIGGVTTKAPGVEDEPNQLEMKGLLVTASLPDETAAASTSKTKGLSAFTYGLLETYPAVDGRRSAEAILRSAATHLKQTGFRQTPMILEARAPGDLKYRGFITFDAASARMVADEKFWGAFASVLPSLISAVGPSVLNALTGRSKALPSELSGPEGAKLWAGLGRRLADLVRGCAPIVVAALTRGQAKSNDSVVAGADGIEPEGTEKFWGALVTVLPSVISAVTPLVANALSGRGKSGEWPAMTEGEAAPGTGDEKFLWEAAVTLLPSIVSNLSPAIREPMLGRMKGFSTTPDGDGPVPDAKFWGAVAAILPRVIQTAAPLIIDAVAGARRKAEVTGVPAQMAPAEATEAAGDDKFWQAIAEALPQIISAVGPVIMDTMRGQTKGFDAVEEFPAEGEKFWGTVASIVRPLVSAAAPIIIRALTAGQKAAVVKGPVMQGVAPISHKVLTDTSLAFLGGFSRP